MSASPSFVPIGPEAALDPDSDEHVVEQILDGAPARFEVLMRRHNQRLFRAARAILADDAEAEDAVQQAYLAAYRKLDQFGGRARFSTWLTRIAIREALRRRGKATPALLDDGLDESALEGSALDPERASSAAELRARLEDALAALPDGYRAVVVLRDVQELSTRETAESLDMTEEAVRVRLHRARHALRARLTEGGALPVSELYPFAGERCHRIVRRVLSAIAAEGQGPSSSAAASPSSDGPASSPARGWQSKHPNPSPVASS